MKYIILGTAHLKSTPGKRSPDGKFFEYKYSRDIIKEIKKELEKYDFKVFIDIEEEDLPLNQSQELLKRVKVVNQICDKYKAQNCIYISIHVNAAYSDNKWHNATGWEAYTSKGSTKADILAGYLYINAKKYLFNKKIRTDYSDNDADKEANFYVLKNTKCPAVLTENFFMDNKDDVNFLLSNEGKNQIIQTHVNGILDYCKNN